MPPNWESSSAIFVYRVWVFLVVSFSGHSLMESIFSRFAANFSVILQILFSSVEYLPLFSWYVP